MVDPIETMLDDTLRVLCGGVDSDKAAHIVEDALDALARQVSTLKGLGISKELHKTKCPSCSKAISIEIPVRPESLARSISLTAKMIDDTARLIHFTQGRPDSRTGSGQSDWLKSLTNEQFAQVQVWVEENIRVGVK